MGGGGFMVEVFDRAVAGFASARFRLLFTMQIGADEVRSDEEDAGNLAGEGSPDQG